MRANDDPMKSEAASSGIVVSYRDPHNVFGSVAQLLLKILSSLQTVADVPAVGDAPRALSDSLGLWPEHESGDSALLSLFLARSLAEVECRTWAEQVRQRGTAGFLGLVLANVGDPPAPAPAAAAVAEWTGLAGALWRKARSHDSVRGNGGGPPPVSPAHAVHLHAVPGFNRDRPAFRNREAKALAAVVARELAAGFRGRMAAGGAGLVRLYCMVSMWPAALAELDQVEAAAAVAAAPPMKQRCRRCGLYVLPLLLPPGEGTAPCVHHPGHFVAVGRFAMPRWSCCGGVEARAPPCRTAPAHDCDAAELAAAAAAVPSLSRVSGAVPLLEHSFRPALTHAAGRVLEASSYAMTGRQQLLAQQCQLLARMKDGTQLVRRVLRFVQLASRARSPLLQPLEFAAWVYRICDEAAKLAKPTPVPRLLQAMRGALVAIGTAAPAVEEGACSPLVLQHRLLAAVFCERTAFADALRRLVGKETAAWSRLGLARHEAAADAQLGLALFALGLFEEAYSQVRMARLHYLLWPALRGRCLQVMAACEARLGLSPIATTLEQCALDPDAPRRLLLLVAQGPPLVKALEPHFAVEAWLDADGAVGLRVACLWAGPAVRPAAVAVELQSSEGARIVVRQGKAGEEQEEEEEEERAPTRLSLRSAWFVRRVTCTLGCLQLVRMLDEGEAPLRPRRPPPPMRVLPPPAEQCAMRARLLLPPLMGLPLVLALDDCGAGLAQVSIWATCRRRSLLDPAVVAERAGFGRVLLPMQGLGLGSHSVELILACRSEPDGAARPAFVTLEATVERPVRHRACVAWANGLWHVGVELQCHPHIAVRRVILDRVSVVACGSTERRFWFAVAAGTALDVGQLVLSVEYVYGEDVVFLSRVRLEEPRSGHSAEELPWLLPAALSPAVTAVNVYGNGFTADTLVALLSALKYRSGGTLAQLDLGRNDIGVSAMAVGALAALVAAGTALRGLRLWDTRLGVAHVEAVLIAARQQGALLELELGKNDLGPEAFGHVAAFVAADPSLQTLGLWYNRGGDTGARALMKV